MTNLLIKKVIAKEGEREIVDSSYEEMNRFITNISRPDFSKSDVLCIKFLTSDNEDLKDAEETCWYINPEYSERLRLIRINDEKDAEDSVYGTEETEVFYPDYIFITDENNSIQMPSNLLPELLLMFVPDHEESIFDTYVLFEAELIQNGLIDASDKQKYELFVQSLK